MWQLCGSYVEATEADGKPPTSRHAEAAKISAEFPRTSVAQSTALVNSPSVTHLAQRTQRWQQVSQKKGGWIWLDIATTNDG